MPLGTDDEGRGSHRRADERHERSAGEDLRKELGTYFDRVVTGQRSTTHDGQAHVIEMVDLCSCELGTAHEVAGKGVGDHQRAFRAYPDLRFPGLRGANQTGEKVLPAIHGDRRTHLPVELLGRGG